MAHRSGRIGLTDLNGSRRYSGARVHSRTKLANVPFSAGPARGASASGTSLPSDTVSPGSVRTPFPGEGGSRGFALLERVTLTGRSRAPVRRRGTPVVIVHRDIGEQGRMPTGRQGISRFALYGQRVVWDRTGAGMLFPIPRGVMP
ncbi:hypothetical protein [Streptomyces fumanus]|uniref:hypothetical protein n=1 Tax=Streptomyces fumanus TaxID=67302 RepID=UPI0033DF2666